MNASNWDRLVHNYHEHIISPYAKGVKNPLKNNLNKLNSKSIIADIGCGRGEILPFLSKKFKSVYAFDFSKNMIKYAKEKNKQKNIRFYIKDIKKMQEFNNKFDAVIAINSLLMPKNKDANKSFKSVYSILKSSGTFLAVFPAIESILYQAFLIGQEQHKKHNEKEAIKKTKRILEYKKYDFLNGIYDDDGEKQKFYFDFELRVRLSDIGFRNINISKVLYPWGMSDYEDFHDRPKMWDWFVSAKK